MKPKPAMFDRSSGLSRLRSIPAASRTFSVFARVHFAYLNISAAGQRVCRSFSEATSGNQGASTCTVGITLAEKPQVLQRTPQWAHLALTPQELR